MFGLLNIRHDRICLYYFHLKLLILFSTIWITFVDGDTCEVIVNEARQPCTNEDVGTESACTAAGCCWTLSAASSDIQCYEKGCKSGYFGWGCRYKCQCNGGGSCNRWTGECQNGCTLGSWGVGCLLDNNCKYNDEHGIQYMGSRYNGDKGETCLNWNLQNAYPANQFPDRSITAVRNYCRNPLPKEPSAWCYYQLEPIRKWATCTLNSCECPLGRYGVNCVSECHCRDISEQCDKVTGMCRTGCHQHWTGYGCQDCANGYFGQLCNEECHCSRVGEACDRDTGYCRSGCARGWTGAFCQTECPDGYFGTQCEMKCNCKNEGEVCSKDTGSCQSGCRAEYSGDGCNIWLPVMTRAPELETRTATSLTVRWRSWRLPIDRGNGPVKGYIVFYRLKDDGAPQDATSDWIKLPSVEKGLRMVVIPDLLQEAWYEVRVAAIHQEGYEGVPSPSLNIRTCGRPLSGPLKVEYRTQQGQARTLRGLRKDRSVRREVKDESSASSDDVISLEVTWKQPPVDEYNCESLHQYKVYTASPAGNADWTLVDTVHIPRAVLTNFDPYTNASIGVSLVNNALLESNISTVFYIGKSGRVESLTLTPLHSESAGGSSLLISWSPPRSGSSPVKLYLVRYREDRLMDCSEKDEGMSQWSPLMDVVDTKLQLPDLKPYRMYEVKVWPKTVAGQGEMEQESAVTLPAPPPPVKDLSVLDITSTSVRLTWAPISCLQYNGIFKGYAYILRRQTQDEKSGGREAGKEGETDDQVVFYTNDTDIQPDQLVPWSEYTAEVWGLNHAEAGPRATITFKTLEDVPLAPAEVTIRTSLVDSLLIGWSAPYPLYGPITSYELLVTTPNHTALTLSPDTYQYNLTGLASYTDYAIKVRAYTRIGSGPWSNVIYGRTDESLPSEPTHFLNISRSSTSVLMRWQKPLKPNGKLTAYRMSCQPLADYGKKDLQRIVEKSISPRDNEFEMGDLHPGTHYQCSLRAFTSKGPGPDVIRVFWTEPHVSVSVPEPGVEVTKATEHSVALILKPVAAIDNMEEADRLYRIVVEMKRRRQRSRRIASMESTSTATPCGLSHVELVDHYKASLAGADCYVAAEIPHVDDGQLFVVGDNRTYGGYYNSPLDKTASYQIWFGIVVTVDGVTASSYSKTDVHLLGVVPIEDELLPGDGGSSGLAGAAVGTICAVLVVVVIVIVVIIFIRKKRNIRHNPYRENLPSIDTTENGDSRVHDEKGLLKRSGESDELSDVRETATLLSPMRHSDKHQPVPVEELWTYVAHKKLSTTDGFKQEYEDLPQSYDYSCVVAKKPENKLKNRYGNIIAYDHSRVKLDCLPGDPHSDYINGNYIDGYKKPAAFVASQGPSKQTLSDIWRMAWQLNSTRIIMVTNLIEDGRQKCEQYWPENQSEQYGDITVENVEMEQFADFRIRTFIISKSGVTERKTIRQFHFTTWPDHGVPAYPTSLLAFRKKVHHFAGSPNGVDQGPILVHCSAGVGRTGTYIAVDHLIEQAKAEGLIDVFNCVRLMRRNRVNMVQTLEQYIFVYDALLEALKSGDTAIPCVEFRQRYTQLLLPSSNAVSPLQEQYELLGTMTKVELSSNQRAVDALSRDNINKNRCKEIVPVSMMCQPFLLTYIPGCNEYINAVFIDGYKQRDAYIVTQAPLPNTINDFWAMVVDHGCRTIVMMNEADMTDETLGSYFPLTKGSSVHGPFSIEVTSVERDDNIPGDHSTISSGSITTRDISITIDKQKSAEPIVIRHFQYQDWPKSSALPTNKSSVIALLNSIEKWQQRSGNGVIVVHCLDGATRSGLLCAVSYMVEQLKVEQEVDVFQSVKHTRISRPQLIPTYDQYKFLHDMAVEYMDCFETYSNFK